MPVSRSNHHIPTANLLPWTGIPNLETSTRASAIGLPCTPLLISTNDSCQKWKHKHPQRHTHKYVYMYIYIYRYIDICVFVYTCVNVIRQWSKDLFSRGPPIPCYILLCHGLLLRIFVASAWYRRQEKLVARFEFSPYIDTNILTLHICGFPS